MTILVFVERMQSVIWESVETVWARLDGDGIEIGKLRHHEPIAVNVTVVGTNAVTTLTVASSVIGS